MLVGTYDECHLVSSAERLADRLHVGEHVHTLVLVLNMGCGKVFGQGESSHALGRISCTHVCLDIELDAVANRLLDDDGGAA